MGGIDRRRTLTPADSREINTEIAEHDEVDEIWDTSDEFAAPAG